MSTKNSTFLEEENLLLRATRSEHFRFMIVQYNHYDIVRHVISLLGKQYPKREMHRLNFSEQLDASLVNTILQCKTGFVCMEYFEEIFKTVNTEIAIGFNQHRDAYSHLPLILIAFIPAGEKYLRELAKRLPDMFSIVSPVVQFEQMTGEINKRFSIDNYLPERLSFKSINEAKDEIKRLEKRLISLGDNPEDLRLKLQLKYNLGKAYYFIVDYKRAKKIFEELLKEASGFPWIIDNSAIQNDLGIVCNALGEYKNAQELLEKVLNRDIENYGEKHPTVAADQSNLASIYTSLGEYKKAQDLLEKALQSDIENFGIKHPNVAIRQSNLGEVYRHLGDYENARKMQEKALQSDIENFGEKHSKVAVDQSNLANVYHSLGEYEKAIKLLEKAMQSDIENFGYNHPNIALRQTNLATIYHDLGNFEKARGLLEKALEADLKFFGKNHPNVANRLNNLAAVYLAIGEKQKAKNLWEKAYIICVNSLGENHPNTKLVKSWLDKL